MHYFPTEPGHSMRLGVEFSAKAIMMWDLLLSHPLVNAIQDGEDSSGRARIRLQTPQETVQRASEIVEIFMAHCESTQQVRPAVNMIEISILRRALERITSFYSRVMTEEDEINFKLSISDAYEQLIKMGKAPHKP